MPADTVLDILATFYLDYLSISKKYKNGSSRWAKHSNYHENLDPSPKTDLAAASLTEALRAEDTMASLGTLPCMARCKHTSCLEEGLRSGLSLHLTLTQHVVSGTPDRLPIYASLPTLCLCSFLGQEELYTISSYLTLYICLEPQGNIYQN